MQRFVLLFATRPHAWQMNFGALTSGLMAFRSIAHTQQVNEHIFSVAQHFVCFAMFFTSLQLKNSVETLVTLRPCAVTSLRLPQPCRWPWRRCQRPCRWPLQHR